MTDEISLLKRRIVREKKARESAELILERKSLELHETSVAAQEAARQLHAQNVKVQAILDYAAEGIITVDEFGKITSFNPAAIRIFGYQPEEITDESLTKLVPDFSENECRSILEAENGVQESRERKGRRLDGSEFILEISFSSVEDTDSPMVIAFVRDRTKRKHLESQLALAQKMESVGQLAAGNRP